MSVRVHSPIRLLTLTTLFPNSHQPRHGIFVANRLKRMRDTGRIESTVFAAVPWFPGAYREAADVPREESVFGFNVRHPRYTQVPGVGMRRQPDSLARALLDDLRRSDIDPKRFDVVDAHYFYPDGVALQDVLGVGSDGRMNVPGRPSGNWRWRFSAEALRNALRERLRKLTAAYGRLPLTASEDTPS
jgi:hypothetical protein